MDFFYEWEEMVGECGCIGVVIEDVVFEVGVEGMGEYGVVVVEEYYVGDVFVDVDDGLEVGCGERVVFVCLVGRQEWCGDLG